MAERTIIAQVEIAIPGHTPMTGHIEYIEGEQVPRLDDVAIQVHGLVNDLVQSIRTRKILVDGKEKDSE